MEAATSLSDYCGNVISLRLFTCVWTDTALFAVTHKTLAWWLLNDYASFYIALFICTQHNLYRIFFSIAYCSTVGIKVEVLQTGDKIAPLSVDQHWYHIHCKSFIDSISLLDSQSPSCQSEVLVWNRIFHRLTLHLISSCFSNAISDRLKDAFSVLNCNRTLVLSIESVCIILTQWSASSSSSW